MPSSATLTSSMAVSIRAPVEQRAGDQLHADLEAGAERSPAASRNHWSGRRRVPPPASRAARDARGPRDQVAGDKIKTLADRRGLDGSIGALMPTRWYGGSAFAVTPRLDGGAYGKGRCASVQVFSLHIVLPRGRTPPPSFTRRSPMFLRPATPSAAGRPRACCGASFAPWRPRRVPGGRRRGGLRRRVASAPRSRRRGA